MRHRPGAEIDDGYFIKPTLLFGQNHMRVFQEEIFGPVASVTTFKDVDDAIRIANDSEYGLGAGVWTRNGMQAYHMGRAIQAGRVWTNCYHAYPAHAAFGGTKSGIAGNSQDGPGNYQQTKNLLVSYNPQAWDFLKLCAGVGDLALRAAADSPGAWPRLLAGLWAAVSPWSCQAQRQETPCTAFPPPSRRHGGPSARPWQQPRRD